MPDAGTPAAAPLLVEAPVHGTVTAVSAAADDRLRAGQVIVTLESMKMEVPVAAPADGCLLALHCAVGDVVEVGALIAELAPQAPGTPEGADRPGPATGSATPRGDLARLRERRARLDDAARPEAVARRHAQGLRTARENVADLLDEGLSLIHI